VLELKHVGLALEDIMEQEYPQQQKNIMEQVGDQEEIWELQEEI
jgi:hypothetical protein